jgi:dTDP-glucose 4,6-dehydratase
LLASTSESYGDPQIHPQTEDYWGNVNPVGPRSVYDEAKRFGEALTMAFRRSRGVDAKIVRIFNTFGPRMRLDDGRAIPTFVRQALEGEPLTVTGDGSQTRSLCYVDDLVGGLVRMMAGDHSGPVNLGTPYEVSMLDLARWIIDLTGSASEIQLVPRPQDDPEKRRPDTTLARELLGWEPRITVEQGLRETIASLSSRLHEITPAEPGDVTPVTEPALIAGANS